MMRRRILFSLFLSIILLLSAIPYGAQAHTGEEAPAAVRTQATEELLPAGGSYSDVENMPIRTPDGKEYYIDDFKEDMVAFFFGRTICGITQGMLEIAEYAHYSGQSVKVVMMCIDQEEGDLDAYQKRHPDVLVSFTQGSYLNNGWRSRFGKIYALNKGTALPTTVIFDHNYELLFGSEGQHEEELVEFFKLTYMDSVKINYDGDRNLHNGDVIKLSATYTPENTSYNALYWYSKNEKVVTVDQDGYVTAVGRGSAYVMVRPKFYLGDSYPYEYIYLTVVDGDYKTLKILYDGDTMLTIGEKIKLNTNYSAEDLPGDTLVWTSSNEKSVTVDQNGNVTAVGNGGSKITVSSALYPKNEAYTDLIVIYVMDDYKRLTGLSIDPPSCTVKVGESVKVNVIFTPEDATNKTIKWSSEDESIATGWNGWIKGVSKGTTMVKVASDRLSASCKVTVVDKASGGEQKDPEETPEYVSTECNMVVKEKSDVTSAIGNGYDKYTVSPKNMGSVNKSGIFSAKKAGTATVTGFKKSGDKFVQGKSLKINISAPSFEKKTITLTKTDATLNAYDLLSVTDRKPDSWISSKETVAIVNSSEGVVTSVGNGTTKISAVFGSGKFAAKYTFTLKVVIPKISKAEASVVTGQALKLTLKRTKLTPEWRSSDSKVCTVSDGKMTAVSSGSAVITATLDGVDYSCSVTVKPPVINKTNLTLAVGKKGKLSLKQTKLKDVSWTSSNPLIAEVDGKGRVTGIKAGTVSIYTNAGGVKNECVVTVE